MTGYHRPETLEAALNLRASADVMPLAGGTDVYPAKVARAGWGDMRHKDVLDLSGIGSLRGIIETTTQWRIGALATWSELLDTPLPPMFDGLKQAAHAVGGVQIQNRGTLVGNLCTASPAGDGAPNLLALDAEIEIASATQIRRVPMSAFIDGYRRTLCAPHELVTGILVPKRDDGARSAFLKLGARRYLVISIAMVAGVVACDGEGRIAHARIAVGACSATPQRLLELEAALTGVPIAEAAAIPTPAHLAALTPIDDVRGTATYRLQAAGTLVADLLGHLATLPARRAA